MKKLLLVSALVVTTLSGCATTPHVDNVVIQKEVKVITPPDYLLNKYDAPKPPNKENYSSLKCDKREVLLGNYTLQLMTVLKQYSKQIDELKDWKAKVDVSNVKK